MVVVVVLLFTCPLKYKNPVVWQRDIQVVNTYTAMYNNAQLHFPVYTDWTVTKTYVSTSLQGALRDRKL